MEALAAFHFLRPQALLLAPLALGVWWWWRRGVDPLRGWRAQMAAALLAALVSGGGPRRLPRGSGLIAAWLIAVLALAGPSWRREPNPLAEDGPPLLILLKADAAMAERDPPPSPLERARLEIADIAAARKGQPLGLIAYAGSAHLVLPPTRDTAVVARMAAEISAEVMPVAGDRLDLALAEAARLLAASAPGGSVVVMADAVAADAAALRALHDAPPAQFLALCAPGSGDCASLDAAARALDADVAPLDTGDADTRAIVRRSARTAAVRSDDETARWQDAGYWLLPPLALLVLGSFRRSQLAETPR